MKLEDLQLLNDEIVAVARAGVPLGPGLLQLSSDRSMPRRLRQITRAVGERLEAGESLGEALRRDPQLIPPVYAAMVEIGDHAGNLTVALENMASHLRCVNELRRLTISTMAYPIVLVILACLGFALCISPTLAAIDRLMASSDYDATTLRVVVNRLQQAAPWLQLLPLVILVSISVWWFVTRRAFSGTTNAGARWFGWVPGARRILQAGSLAMFTNLLQVMIRHQVPLPRSVRLAAEATGHAELINESRAIAEALEQGARSTPTALRARRPLIPGTMRWLIESARSPQELAQGLDRLADSFLRQVHAHEIWTRTVFPIMATVLVGGTVTVAYTLAMMGPWMSSLWQLSQP